jgi:hypothetical protein
MAGEVDFPESVTWRPDDPKADGNHDNPVEGVLTLVDMSAEGQWGRYPILHLDLDDGTSLAVHAFRTVLRNKLTELAPKYGERLKIAWGGEKPTKAGTKYHDYRVMVVGREGGSFNWDALGSGPDEMQRIVYEQPAVAAAGPSDDGIPF